MKFIQKKTTYPYSHDDVFRACRAALSRLKCIIKESKVDYYRVSAGIFPYLFGYIAEIRTAKLSNSETEVSIASKAGLFLLFGRRKRIAENFFKRTAESLNYQKWQKMIFSESEKERSRK